MDVLTETNGDRGAGATIHRRIVGVVATINAHAEPDPDAVLSALPAAAVAILPGVRHAGVSVVADGVVRTPHCTDGLPHLLDQIQTRLGEGPCFQVATTRETLRVDDLGEDSRWPAFCDVAMRETPIRSILAVHLFDDGPGVGALTFYSDHPGVYDDETEGLALMFAAQAALIVENRRREKHFRTALANRDIIGQAKGVLIERFGTDAATAFSLLQRLAGDRGEPVAAVARRIVRDPDLLREIRDE
jgi:GAF domain-containing protein